MVHISIPLIVTAVLLNIAPSLAAPIFEGGRHQGAITITPDSSPNANAAITPPYGGLSRGFLRPGQEKVGRGFSPENASDVAPTPLPKDNKVNQSLPRRVVLYIARKAFYNGVNSTFFKAVVKVGKVNANMPNVDKSVIPQHTTMSAVKKPSPGSVGKQDDAGKSNSPAAYH